MENYKIIWKCMEIFIKKNGTYKYFLIKFIENFYLIKVISINFNKKYLNMTNYYKQKTLKLIKNKMYDF